MKRYAQFMTTDMKGQKVDMIGSDGVFILDARNKFKTQLADAMLKAHRMRHIHNIIGCKIMEGTRFDNSVLIYEWIHSGAIYT